MTQLKEIYMETDDYPAKESGFEYEHQLQPARYDPPIGPDIDDGFVDRRSGSETHSEITDEDPAMREAAEAPGLDETEYRIFKAGTVFADRVRDTLNNDTVQIVETFTLEYPDPDDPDENEGTEVTTMLTRVAFLQERLREDVDAGKSEVEPKRYVVQARLYSPLPGQGSPDDAETRGGLRVDFQGPSSYPLHIVIDSRVIYEEEAPPTLSISVGLDMTEPSDTTQDLGYDVFGVRPQLYQQSKTRIPEDLYARAADPGEFLCNYMPGWIAGDDPEQLVVNHDPELAQRLPETLRQTRDEDNPLARMGRVLDVRDTGDRSLIQDSAETFKKMLDIWAKNFPAHLVRRHRGIQQQGKASPTP